MEMLPQFQRKPSQGQLFPAKDMIPPQEQRFMGSLLLSPLGHSLTPQSIVRHQMWACVLL